MHTIEVINGLLVRRVGKADAKKILCLPGFADSGLMFLPLSETVLPKHFELVLVDLPGFGGSPPQSDITDIRDHAGAVADLAAALSPGEPVGLVGHSIASAIAVEAVALLSPAPIGVFSMEGNLTEEDAYFSGRAADWEAADPFKEAFLNEIWQMSVDQVDLRRYFAGATMAHAAAMWALGQDARRISEDDAVGQAYRALQVPSLYYWSETTTPSRTQQFIKTHSIANRRYEVPSHWPTVADPQATADAICEFFLSAG